MVFYFPPKYVNSFDELFATECFYVQRTNLSVKLLPKYRKLLKISQYLPVASSDIRRLLGCLLRIRPHSTVTPYLLHGIRSCVLESPFPRAFVFVLICILASGEYSPPYTSLHFLLLMSNSVVLLPVEDQERTSSASSPRAAAPPPGGPPSYHSSSSYDLHL